MLETTPPRQSLPPDIVDAIGSSPIPREWPTDAEMGAFLRWKARKDINDHIISTKEDVYQRLRTHAEWLQGASELQDATIIRWMRYEQMYAASALKYINELAAAGKTAGKTADNTGNKEDDAR